MSIIFNKRKKEKEIKEFIYKEFKIKMKSKWISRKGKGYDEKVEYNCERVVTWRE